MRKISLSLACLLATASTSAFATPAIVLGTPGAEYGGGSYTLGFEFSVSGSQMIDALGVYDNLGDGLSSDASIGLWDTSGNLLTSTSILAGGGTLDGLFRYNAITPFALSAGTHYVVGAFTRDLASSLNTGQGGSGSINPLVTIYGDRYSNFNNAFSFPGTSDSNVSGAWLGANFNLASQNSAVPEPGTWALMLVGFGLVGAGMRRQKANVSVSYA